MKQLEYSLRVRLIGEQPFFGPGATELLQLVEETGSLHTAAARMGLSYSKAWRMIKTAESELGFPVLLRQAGGSGGGGSVLSPQGRLFLEEYIRFRQEVCQAADQMFHQYFDHI